MGTIPQLSVVRGPSRHINPENLNRIFEKVASGQSAMNTAIIFKENDQIRQHTYDQVNKITNKLARAIHHEIVHNNLARNSDGDYIVAVNMNPSEQLVMVLLAIWKSGTAYLPLDHAFPGPRIEHILKESKPALVIYDKDSEFYMGSPKISLDQLLVASAEQDDANLCEDERVRHIKDDLAVVLYTSGSTGIPKGVRLPHKVILNRLQWQFKRFPYSATEKVCVFKTALTFVDSVCEIWGPLLNGLAVLVVPRSLTKDPEKLIDLLGEYKIERLVLVPSLLRSLLMYLQLQKTKAVLGHLKTWVCSGEILAVSLAEEFFDYFPEGRHELCNFYGSTEIMGDVTYHVISYRNQLDQHQKVPIGVPIDNTMVYLLDKDFRPVNAGDVGELFASGLNLAAGYVNGRDPDKFLENPLAIDPAFSKLYRTGDFARLENGTLIYEGRTDSQVKIRGNRVDLTEVERAVHSIEGVDKAVVLCYKPGEISQALLAFVTTKKLMTDHQIEILLRDKLTSYMIPQVILIDTVPLLVNGKIDRQALLKTYENTNNNDDFKPEVEISYEGVSSHLMTPARHLFETVASVLGRAARSAISIDANFYEIGGNSLNSIFTISRLADKGYHINIGDFISAANFEEILYNMTSATKSNKQPHKFTAELLKPEDKMAVLDMVTTSFYQKADLEQWIISEISESDYDELIDALWEPLVEKNLSFVAKSESGKIVGVALNFDARDEPEVEIKSKLTVIFEFLESIEGPVRDNKLPPGKGQILHSFMMATHSSLSAKENVAVMQFMEDEVLNLARSRNFSGIFTTNTSPLTQQLGTDVHKYQIMLDCQVNQYVASDNTKPFGQAPDDQRAIVQWKPINA
ncbi:beta-alanyl-bioamine nonribosomal peptide synthetase ebony isoform X2 [Cylas formicarius]|uniref:beta-alanyl-bioamine nonribosomal peptide synthetase ebony isoform X2 n=1 Tax=Cylas formicarius TaxID=197179 RepID=UPI0029586A84|nr:beta-alanyl-bioamine nonribosomal peptide synthetase ebony isoform X2 [Cylas formicarius]